MAFNISIWLLGLADTFKWANNKMPHAILHGILHMYPWDDSLLLSLLLRFENAYWTYIYVWLMVINKEMVEHIGQYRIIIAGMLAIYLGEYNRIPQVLLIDYIYTRVIHYKTVKPTILVYAQNDDWEAFNQLTWLHNKLLVKIEIACDRSLVEPLRRYYIFLDPLRGISTRVGHGLIYILFDGW